MMRKVIDIGEYEKEKNRDEIHGKSFILNTNYVS